MPDANARTDTIDVEHIMRQLRARIRERRGADYTETELDQLAAAKLEQLLEARGARGLLDRLSQTRPPGPDLPSYEFEDSTMFSTHRGLRAGLRKLLRPILKLFVNLDPVSRALHLQAQLTAEYQRRFKLRDAMDPVLVELIRGLVLETTRAGLEVQSLKMRLESLSTRLDFEERRVRSREPGPAAAPSRHVATRQPVAPDGGAAAGAPHPEPQAGADSQAVPGERRRRRRRRRRRGGGTAEHGPRADAPPNGRQAGVESGEFSSAQEDAGEPHRASSSDAVDEDSDPDSDDES
jgi:hypothetical protein